MRKIAVCFLLVLFSLYPSNVAANNGNSSSIYSNDSDYFEQQRILTVGFIPGKPPFQYVENGEYLGFNIDSLKFIADAQDLILDFKPVSLREGIEKLNDGTIDILSGIHFTDELNEQISFTESILTSSLSVVVPKDSEILNVSHLQNKTVAMQIDTVEYEFLKNIHNLHMHIAFEQHSAFKLLMKERSDAFVGDYLTTSYLLDLYDLSSEYEFADSYLLPVDHTFSVKKDKTLLLQTLNNGIRQYKISQEIIPL